MNNKKKKNKKTWPHSLKTALFQVCSSLPTQIPSSSKHLSVWVAQNRTWSFHCHRHFAVLCKHQKMSSSVDASSCLIKTCLAWRMMAVVCILPSTTAENHSFIFIWQRRDVMGAALRMGSLRAAGSDRVRFFAEIHCLFKCFIWKYLSTMQWI